MKQNFFLLLGLMFIFSVNSFAQNVGANNSKMIIGKWKIDSLDVGDSPLAVQYKQIVEEKMAQIIETTEVLFYPNKKYLKKGFDGTTEGTWRISKDGQYVSVKIKGRDKEDRTKIISITDDKLIIAPDDPNAVNAKVYMYKAK
ncbi:MAG TPA: lipocalin family protein [Bacteroidales bacterium]|nr:lipocalin family protein [Bacteroidales bacterium]HOR61126.1 lipocalin family protein [Bacteroidales bacterium]HPL05548.1 lipocalin family protein [Bacteroidales bacterium]